MLKITISEIISLSKISGASGIAKYNSSVFIICDNSPYLYRLDLQFKIVEKIQIYSINDFNDNAIDKHLKPDFEAIELINSNELILFGSGSKSPERNIFKRVFLNKSNEVKSYDISEFYEYLESLDVLKHSFLNIEAVAYFEGNMYLFNRKKPIIFKFDYQYFINYLEQNFDLPEIECTEVGLPNLKDIDAGFSGATISTKTSQLIFTASLENTPNAYDDGEVLGSFLGIVDFKQITNKDAYRFIKIEGNHLPFKVESVAIVDELDSSFDLVFVTDSDDDESLDIKAKLLY
jgi:hypothetical protein